MNKVAIDHNCGSGSMHASQTLHASRCRSHSAHARKLSGCCLMHNKFYHNRQNVLQLEHV